MAKKKESKKQEKEQEDKYRPKIRIKVKAHDHKIIDQALKSIIEAIEKTGAKFLGPIPLPTEKKVYTVNRSTFVHKDHRDQFETRLHKRLIDVVEVAPKTVEMLTDLHLPAGVDIEIKM